MKTYLVEAFGTGTNNMYIRLDIEAEDMKAALNEATTRLDPTDWTIFSICDKEQLED